MIEKINNNKAFKIIAMLFKTIVSFFIIIVISIIFIQRISNNKVSLGGYSLFTVVTESMVPKYNVFDMIVAKEVDTNDIKVGDDVVYLGKKSDFAGKIVTHEVIKIDKIDGNTYFHTKGIANDVEDPLVSADQIMGRISFKSHILSFISRVVNNIYGFYFDVDVDGIREILPPPVKLSPFTVKFTLCQVARPNFSLKVAI